jgi:hypothetical protein
VPQLNLNSLAAVTSANQLSQTSFPAAVAAADQAAAAAAAANQQAKKFRLPLKTVSKSQKYIPKPIPQELGNLKTYSK